jgi:hypothetical protein
MEIAEALKKHGIESKMLGCTVDVVECPECKGRHLLPNKCDSRLCPFDERRYSAERVGLYEGLVKRARNGRFFTLTGPLVSYDADLADGIRRRRDAFGRLRRSKVLGLVRAGVYAIEIVLRPGGYHVHFHVLVDSQWVENRNERGRPLEESWKRFLEAAGVPVGDGKRVSVDIRPATKQTIKETLKYTAKGALAKDDDDPDEPGEVLDDATLVQTGEKRCGDVEPPLAWSEVPETGLRQLVEVLEGGVHLVEPFGEWRGALGEYRELEKAEARQKQEERLMCQKCHVLMRVVHTVSWGSPWLVLEEGELACRPPPKQLEWIEHGYQAWKHGREQWARELEAKLDAEKLARV